MPLDPTLRTRLLRDASAREGERAIDDTRRLWGRVRMLLTFDLLSTAPDEEALELATMGLATCPDVPGVGGSGGSTPSDDRSPRGSAAVVSLRTRAEAAAEYLVGRLGDAGDDASEALLDRTCRLLYETPQREPVVDDAKLLADAVNLDDYGAAGVLIAAVRHGAAGRGTRTLTDALVRRQQYGYWEARLRHDFHFETTRLLAETRVGHAHALLDMLEDEATQDVE